MRIALVAHRPAEAEATGTGRYVRSLASSLARAAGREDEVLLVCTPERRPSIDAADGMRREQLPWSRRPVQVSWCAGLGPRLERALGELDVLHLTQPFPPAPSVAPQLVTVHDLFPLERPDWYPLAQRAVYRASLHWTVRRARRVVAPSRHVAEQLLARGIAPDRVEVVHHGVSGIFLEPRPQSELAALCARFTLEPGSYVIVLGAVSTRKNLVVVSRAMARLADRDMVLVLVGPDGVGAASVHGEIARLDGTVRVVRTGYLADAEVAGLVQGAAALLHPSLSEGFGLVPLEAMAAGTPVVASRAGAVPEVVGTAALLVDEPRDAARWARALAELLSDSRRRSELSAAGREQAAQFSWEEAARRMLELYREVARG